MTKWFERNLIRMCNNLLLATSLLMLQKKVYRRPTLTSECMRGRRVRMWECLHKTISSICVNNPPSHHPFFVISFANGKIIALTIQCDSGCPTIYALFFGENRMERHW